MTVQECYKELGCDYNALLLRVPSEALIIKLCKKFLDDKNMSGLESAIKDNNQAEAFSAVHTLKGIALNLEFKQLSEASSALTEHLRNGSLEGSDLLFEQTKTAYEEVISCLKKLD